MATYPIGLMRARGLEIGGVCKVALYIDIFWLKASPYYNLPFNACLWLSLLGRLVIVPRLALSARRCPAQRLAQHPRGATSDGHWPTYVALVGTYSACVASYKCAPKSALPGA